MNSCRKGKAMEREAAREIRRIFGTDAKRSEQHCGQAGDADLCDGAIPGCHVEVKTRAEIKALRYMDQASRDAPSDRIPLVILRENRGRWHVMLTLEGFAAMMGYDVQQAKPKQPAKGRAEAFRDEAT